MSKKARKEGNKVACLIKANKAEFYIADVDLGDNSKDVLAAVNCVLKTLGKFKSAFMLISAGKEKLSVTVHVPEEFSDRCDAKEWLVHSVMGIDGELTDNLFVAETTTPFKLIDTVRGNGFYFLKKNGLVEDEESSEEFIGFDELE